MNTDRRRARGTRPPPTPWDYASFPFQPYFRLPWSWVARRHPSVIARLLRDLPRVHPHYETAVQVADLYRIRRAR